MSLGFFKFDRIGLAYRIGDKTVLRSGIGRFYARPGVADNIFLGGNPPFQPMVSIDTGSADNPGAGEATDDEFSDVDNAGLDSPSSGP